MARILPLATAATVAAGVALAAATPASATAPLKVIEKRSIYVESDFSSKSARVAIRLVRRGNGRPYWQFDHGGGHWERCFQNCYEAYRKEVLDFWEEHTDDKGDGSFN